MAVIDQYRSLLTVLVEFEVSADKGSDYVAKIKEFLLGTVKLQPGFVSANLHISTDGKKIINYEQWRTEQDYQNFIANVDLQAKALEIYKKEPSITLMTVALAS